MQRFRQSYGRLGHRVGILYQVIYSVMTCSCYAALYHHFIWLSSLYCICKAVDGGRANWAKTEAFLQLCSFSTVGVGTYSFDDNDDNEEDVKPNSN